MNEKEKKCPDCDYCQSCSKTRCRLCKRDKGRRTHSRLAKCFTYKEYMQWKLDKERRKTI